MSQFPPAPSPGKKGLGKALEFARRLSALAADRPVSHVQPRCIHCSGNYSAGKHPAPSWGTDLPRASGFGGTCPYSRPAACHGEEGRDRGATTVTHCLWDQKSTRAREASWLCGQARVPSGGAAPTRAGTRALLLSSLFPHPKMEATRLTCLTGVRVN